CRRFRYYYNLSAGRVQTPVLGWIIERAEEAKEKINEYRLLINGTRIYFTELDLIGKPQVLKQFFKKTKTVDVDVKIDVIEEKEETINPPPPYTTDSMIMDANRYLGLGAPETMRIAQNLFEMGLITYHRTDSTRVSDRGIQVARDWLKDTFGDDADKLFRPRRWGEGGAHEAIRPTRPIDADNLRRLVEEGVLPIAGRLTAAHYRLYDLIFRRFMASQMREAIVKRAVYKVEILGSDSYITVDRIVKIGRDEDPISKGFTLVWYYIREQHALEPGLKAAVLEHVRKRSKVPLYTEGDIIRLMKERGIGRPSTYAKIVETLYRRRYISRGPEDRVIPTHRGKAIYEYLTREIAVNPRGLEKLIDYEYLKKIPSLVAEERTRALQEKMEEIEKGVAERIVIMNEVYSEIEGIARPVVAAYQSDSNELAKCISGYRRSREAVE
ncbi:MAG: DNA topoisomerase, partial [Desulfurococcales archaeon]|nr:DNA topoisomerase [Desulfurococcales archaeon]